MKCVVLNKNETLQPSQNNALKVPGFTQMYMVDSEDEDGPAKKQIKVYIADFEEKEFVTSLLDLKSSINAAGRLVYLNSKRKNFEFRLIYYRLI